MTETARIWWVVAGLALGPAISNGFARFAYGLLLPSMRSDLGWTFTEAGWINTANAIGYLAGAVLALSLINRVGATTLFVGGLVVTTLSLIASGLTRDFAMISLWRVLAGVGGAPVFVAGGAIASTLFADAPRRNALAIAIYFGGGGLGMVMCAIVVPAMLSAGGAGVWPWAWIAIGVMSALASVPALVSALRVKTPAEVRRHEDRNRGCNRGRNGARTNDSDPVQASGAEEGATGSRLPILSMGPALGAYFLFGVGYTIYITFLIAWMRADGAGWSLVSATWGVMGAMVMASPFIWRGVLARAEGGGAIALTLLASASGVAVALVFGGSAGVILSAAVFGASFFMTPTSTTTFGRKNLPERQWGASLALFTVLFSLGQIFGPVGAGVLADMAGGVEEGLIASAVILAMGGLTGAMQRRLVR